MSEMYLSKDQKQRLEQSGYEMVNERDGFSSYFYDLIKNNTAFILKFDKTETGSIWHQVELSKVQRENGIEFIPITEFNEAENSIIMTKLSTTKFLKSLDVNTAYTFGKAIDIIHASSYANCMACYSKKPEIVSFEKSIEYFVYLAQIRINQFEREE